MRGLVIGKFYPPHNGHHFLIDTALKHSDELDVLIVNNPAYYIPVENRRKWIESRHPKAHVHVIPDIYDEDNSEAWAKHTIAFLGYSPDTVFSSENYGDAYAKFLGAKHHMVDHDRKKVPVSGTKVRGDFLKYWDFLGREVKAALALRIVVVGAESTGTTTLAQALAYEYSTMWVPEVGRFYAEGVQSRNHSWNDEDFASIARTQQVLENEMAANSDGIIVCDTNATATTLWQKRYLGKSTAAVEKIAQKDTVNLYIITGDEIPFVPDSTRDGEHIRHEMHQWFVDRLSNESMPCIVVTGSIKERVIQSKKYIDEAIKQASAIVDNSPKTR